MTPLQIECQFMNSWCPPVMPLHIDSLLAWATVDDALTNHPVLDDQSYDVLSLDLPLAQHQFGDGRWVWKASMLHTIGFVTQSRRYLTCRTPVQEMHEAVDSGFVSAKGGSSIDTSRGFAKNGQDYYTTEMAQGLVGWCVGDYDHTKYLLQQVSHLGAKRRLGMGELRPYDDGSFFKITPLDAAETLWMRRASPEKIIEESILMTGNFKPPYFDRTRRDWCWVPRDTRLS